MKNGSFLVFRRLTQDVSKFRKGCEQIANDLKEKGQVFSSEKIQAMLIGRWPNGTPLMVNPDKEDPHIAHDLQAVNYFDYGNSSKEAVKIIDEDGERIIKGSDEDKKGYLCPLFAHIRKTNPRTTNTDLGGSAMTLAMQMLRRGITFGKPYEGDDDTERGLLFMAYQTSIHDQFRKTNERWINSRRGPHDGGFELLIGQNSKSQARGRKAIINLDKADFKRVKIKTNEEWVTTTAGGYFFAPAKTALRAFAQSAKEPEKPSMEQECKFVP